MADWASIVAATGALGSFLAALFVFRSQKNRDQAAEVSRLHQMWWGEEMHEPRITTFRHVQEWEENGRNVTPIVKSYRESTSEFESEKLSIARVAFFFADLNAMIDEKLVNEKLAFRVFGDAQFFWFSHFLLAIANEHEIKGNTKKDDSNRVIRWVVEVRSLDERFKRIADTRRS